MSRTNTFFRITCLVVCPGIVLSVPAIAQEWDGTVTDSSGVTIVTNTNQGSWHDTDRWRVEQGLLIGSADGDPDYEFGQIAGISVSPDGRVFVFDQQAQHIQVFDQDGFYLNTIGQAGAGPGEIAAGAGPIIRSGNTIYVPDMANRRVDRFTLDGEDAGSYVLDITDGIPVRWDRTDDGQIVNQMRRIAFPGSTAAPDTMDAIVLRDHDGSPIDTIRQVPSGKTFKMNGNIPEFHFFSAEPAWTMASGHSSYFGVNNEYRIGFYDGNGDLKRITSKPFARHPVTSRDREIFTGFLEKAWIDAGVPEQALSTLRGGVNFEDHYPAFLQFMRGPEESLWVQQIQLISELTEEEAENFNPLLSLGGADWDIFDNNGRYLGEIHMPSRFQPVTFVENEIYGIWRDEFDVQYVLSVRIIGLTGGDS